MAQKTILVTGANGQLGNEIKTMAPLYPEYSFLFAARKALPINDASSIEKYFATHSIDCCINCAAYTAVDKAEAEVEQAFLINGAAVGDLATACKKYNVLFIHISTDYVFNGTANEPYKEDHPVKPVNLYGASKLKGEELALQSNPGSIIIRTSWVYAASGNNFVKTMLRLMKERDSINVVSDQQGSPTYAADLADAIMQIVKHFNGSLPDVITTLPASNIFHYSNAGIITWYQFALTIKEISGSKCIVNPIATAEYPTPAKRPAYSVMDTNKIQRSFDITIPFWKDSLEKCMGLLSK